MQLQINFCLTNKLLVDVPQLGARRDPVNQYQRQGIQTSSTSRSMASTSDKSIDRIKQAWEFYNNMGSPKYWVAPMVDGSELPFRQLCRKYGAQGAYTPMMNSKLFVNSEKYRSQFTTCEEDRPLLVQFCGNCPDTLVAAGKLIQHQCDGIDLNLGCPQRIARRGYYGAYLTQDMDLIKRIVETMAQNLEVPITCKIRVFEDKDKTVEYAKMLQEAGCSVLAVHGRTIDQKQSKESLACWDSIKLVKEALDIPVIANGNVRSLQDMDELIRYTGADGAMSAISLLDNPSLFNTKHPHVLDIPPKLVPIHLLLEYIDYCEQHPIDIGHLKRMFRLHAFHQLGPWLHEYTDIRNTLGAKVYTLEALRDITQQLLSSIEDSGRTEPLPKLSKAELAEIERAEAKARAIAEQQAETDLMAQVDKNGVQVDGQQEKVEQNGKVSHTQGKVLHTQSGVAVVQGNANGVESNGDLRNNKRPKLSELGYD